MHRHVPSILLALTITLALLTVSAPLTHASTVETRYFTSTAITYKGAALRQLNIANSASSESKGLLNGVRIGIRVWVSDSADNETEILPLTGVKAIVVYIGDGEDMATWNCPLTAFAATDKVIVRVYITKLTPIVWQLQQTFVSEALGASSLDAATWTIYYWLYKPTTTLSVFYGSNTYPSRITGFTWTQATTQTWNTVSSWGFSLSRFWFSASTQTFSFIREWFSSSTQTFSFSRDWFSSTLWAFDLTRAWFDITTWSLDFTRAWITSTVLEFSFSRDWINISTSAFDFTQAWVAVSSWTYSFSRGWFDVGTLAVDFTMGWVNAALWAFQFIYVEWRDVVFWLFTLGEPEFDLAMNFFMILISVPFALALGLVFYRRRRKRLESPDQL